MASLLITSGINKGDYYPLAEGVFTVGRDAKNTAQVIDDRVSRQHLRVRFDHESGRYLASDAGSRNGSSLNKKPLDQETTLADGDVLAIGDTSLRFSDQDFPNKESALEHYRERRWFGEDIRSTIV